MLVAVAVVGGEGLCDEIARRHGSRRGLMMPLCTRDGRKKVWWMDFCWYTRSHELEVDS